MGHSRNALLKLNFFHYFKQPNLGNKFLVIGVVCFLMGLAGWIIWPRPPAEVKAKNFELDNRPYLHVQADQMSYDARTLTFSFPVKNKGKSVARNVSFSLISDQLSYAGKGHQSSSEEIAPEKTHVFHVPATRPANAAGGLSQADRNLVAKLGKGDVAITFQIALAYTWNGKLYETLPQYGALTKDGLESSLRVNRAPAAHSYADSFVEPLLPNFGYACEVGANDGESGSNTLLFERKGWYVLCIEPNPLLAEAGRKSRKLWRDVACGEVRTNMEFTSVGDYPYASYSGFHADEEFPGLGPAPTKRHKYMVEVIPLGQLLIESGFPRLDLLSIDVEGHELQVLRGVDLKQWRPKFIIAESIDDGPSVADYLKPFGYAKVARKNYDNIYQRQEEGIH